MNPEETHEQVVSPSEPLLLPARAPWYKRTPLLITIGVAVLIIISTGYYVTRDAVVGTVNGEKISLMDLEKNILGIERTAQQQGIDTTTPEVQAEIRKQALQILVDNTLLLQASDKAGIVVTDEQVDQKFAEIVQAVGGIEVLESELALVGVTVAELKEDTRDRLRAELYIESMTNTKEVTVTDAEITTFYGTLDPTQVGPLEEIRSDIEAYLLEQKRQPLISNLVAKLRSEAQIDVRME